MSVSISGSTSTPTIPRPNWELAPAEQTVACVIFGVAALAALAYMIYAARDERKPWPIYLFLGCGLGVFYEPINNVLGHCTYPEINQFVWISTFGRDIPAYIGFVYFFYFSASILWISRRIAAGITTRQWWKYYAVFTVLVTCFEFVPISRGWWMYYGDNQAMRVLGFPMWWWVLNSYCLFVIAAGLHQVRRRLLTNRSSWLIIPMVPMALFAVHGAAAIPIFTALNSTTNTTITTLATLASMVLALGGMWLTSKFTVTQPAPSAATAPVPTPRPATPVAGN
jgi:hypothetical protein